ncbi:MAG TPA: 3-phosphoshikimate 1-carboxyvinyltransferase [Gemmatimonadaceae bacterium]|nr:3-phosphoshikimate 1-carboxyvinyltransferase [Gemmatimonadaceae bacterium]
MRVAGRVEVPGDKSISHRALMLAALAHGRSRIRSILRSADVESTAAVCRALGVAIPPLMGDLLVVGRGPSGLRTPAADLDCGNSGTTARLIAGIVAARPMAARFVGDRSLSRRPMRRVARPLEAMGARVELEGGEGLPMRVHGGALRSLSWDSETASAQVKSAILLAAATAGVRATVREPARSRDHTERMLAARGARVTITGTSVTVEPTGPLAPLDVTVPGDPSSAAFFAALAALAESGAVELPRVCANETRTGFLDTLVGMGARVTRSDVADEGGEPVATLRVEPGDLRGTAVGGDAVPRMIDELPMLACVGARARGETRIIGAGELRVKESDRIAAVVANLRAIGADAEELPDGLVVQGSERPLRGRVTTHGDHRLAMAFGVLGALDGNAIEIDDRACVAVSYPGFWDDLRRVVVRGR